MTTRIKSTFFNIKVIALVGIVLAGGGQVFIDSSHGQAAGINANITNWWPTDGVAVAGVQPFKGVLENWDVSQYDLFWSVDNGPLNYMATNYNGQSHKEADVNVTGWRWNANNNYAITYVAKTKSGEELAGKSFKITIPHQTAAVIPALSSSTTASNPVAIIPAIPTSSTAPTAPQIANSATALATPGINFYVDPGSAGRAAANSLLTTRPADASMLDKIASQPAAKWFGDWNTNIQADTAKYVTASQGALPVLVSYDIPQRDCGGYSAGGTTPNAYLTWVQGMAAGIGTHPAWVILEPDALASMDCLSTADQATRLSLLSQAVIVLKANSATRVYIDTGNPHWQTVSVAASRLKAANIEKADGFSSNISNFISTNDNLTYDQLISTLLSSKHFVIDTSRNGAGSAPNGAWCNPEGRALGNLPTAQTGVTLADAFLWIKAPGESDGACNSGPNAGVWWTDYALGLAQRANL